MIILIMKLQHFSRSVHAHGATIAAQSGVEQSMKASSYYQRRAARACIKGECIKAGHEAFESATMITLGPLTPIKRM
jgi:hypothetical protein